MVTVALYWIYIYRFRDVAVTIYLINKYTTIWAECQTAEIEISGSQCRLVNDALHKKETKKAPEMETAS